MFALKRSTLTHIAVRARAGQWDDYFAAIIAVRAAIRQLASAAPCTAPILKRR